MVNTVALAILFARSHDATLMDAHMMAPAPLQPPMGIPIGVPEDVPFEVEPQFIQVDVPALQMGESVEE
jgi:hypothetical protein